MLSWYAILRSLPKDRSTGKVIELNDIYIYINIYWYYLYIIILSLFDHWPERQHGLAFAIWAQAQSSPPLNTWVRGYACQPKQGKWEEFEMRQTRRCTAQCAGSNFRPAMSGLGTVVTSKRQTSGIHIQESDFEFEPLISWTFKWLAFAGKGIFQHQALFLIHLSKATVLNCLHESLDLSN